ncbi:Hypothetical predicted protein [Paramuricea clavata]|uniref:Uncharacterized protein n=1 Tax=Paramuricea clavata TaxID=317549 RepID=A0A6S7JWF5_PARCT|nr:Hypothetical predicted protein [Paramuricea clavata]
MADSEVEEMLLESEILALKLDDILKVAQNIKLDESSVQGKSRFMILKAIREAIEETVGKLTEKTECVKYIESIKVFLGPPSLEEPDDQGEGPQKEAEVSEVVPQEKSEVVELEEKIQELLSKQKEIKLKAQEKKGTGVSKEGSVQPEIVIKVPLANLEKSLLHRDFKIQGVVGEPRHKDKLGYQSLLSQIEAGVRKQYSELEIVNAVVRAVQPGLQLRSYLESVTDLTLPSLRKIIRFHYHEKSATELYQMLANNNQKRIHNLSSFEL